MPGEVHGARAVHGTTRAGSSVRCAFEPFSVSPPGVLVVGATRGEILGSLVLSPGTQEVDTECVLGCSLFWMVNMTVHKMFVFSPSLNAVRQKKCKP